MWQYHHFCRPNKPGFVVQGMSWFVWEENKNKSISFSPPCESSLLKKKMMSRWSQKTEIINGKEIQLIWLTCWCYTRLCIHRNCKRIWSHTSLPKMPGELSEELSQNKCLKMRLVEHPKVNIFNIGNIPQE